jgi:hypothetical protein
VKTTNTFRIGKEETNLQLEVVQLQLIAFQLETFLFQQKVSVDKNVTFGKMDAISYPHIPDWQWASLWHISSHAHGRVLAFQTRLKIENFRKSR